MTEQKKTKRLFGTNGVRGIIGTDMTPPMVMRIGAAFGSMRKGTIAVGRDTRTSGSTLIYALKSGLLSAGCHVVDCGILPTPALQFIVRKHFDGGCMITASHNPPEYNGVKIIEPDGTEMGDEETIKLENRLFSESFSLQSWKEVGKEYSSTNLLEEYIHTIVAHFPPGIGNGIRVVVDPGSGPSAVTTAEILTRLGCTVFTINDTMDGTFPCRLPEPSPEGLKALSNLVGSTRASFGVAHDGDADRAVFIDETGAYIEENQEFGIIADHICSQTNGIIVTPVSTSGIIEKIAQKYGCRVVYTPVGSIYVARTMLNYIDKGDSIILGGEGNGGIIYPFHQFCRDGGMTAAMMVSVLKVSKQPLSDLVRNLPARYMIKEKKHTSNITEIIEQIKNHFSDMDLNITDGIRISNESQWALIRSSGTEPLIRIIIEAKNREIAENFYKDIMSVIGDLLDNS
jgi:phosphomannomutase/phosphoglucomutase